MCACIRFNFGRNVQMDGQSKWKKIKENFPSVVFQRQTQTCPDALWSHGAQQGVQHQLSLELNLPLS